MLLKNKFQLFAILSFAILGLTIGVIYFQFWGSLTPEEQQIIGNVAKNYIGYFFISLVLVVFGCGLAIDHILNTYILPTKRLVEELTVVSSVNISHRLNLEGSKDIETAAKLINQLAQRLEISKNEIDQTIHQARLELEEEKNRLAAVISGLPEGVVICNSNWQIILYNQQAKSLLAANSSEDNDSSNPGVLGLGRSVLGVINKNQIVHAFDEISNRIQKDDEQPGYHFAHATDGGLMLNVFAIPILTSQKEIYGFVLVLKDITQKMDIANQRDLYLDKLITSIRSSMSSIRAAMETIIDFPDMKSEELSQLRKVILDESITLSRYIDGPEAQSLQGSKTEYPMEDFQCQELLKLIQKKAQDSLSMKVAIEELCDNFWVRIDSFSLVHAVLYMLIQIEDSVKPTKKSCRMIKSGKSVVLDIFWEGESVSLETFNSWEDRQMIIGDETIPLTLKDMVDHYKISIWPQVTADGYPCLRIMLPLLPSKTISQSPKSAISIESRTEFYDFDMFNSTPEHSKFEEIPLNDLIYTVFDTETTGLNPKEDEIISIGALRIVNGRLLKEESYDQLVNPKRSVPEESIKFHGIRPEMLTDQPDIKSTLPHFFRFVEDTVLIAHNAAFDMKMLQMKEAETGIAFKNPVLDTLLLSAVIQPAQSDHNIEAIAKRLGIRIIGRHTALGDAMVTGELFLKMIPLLQAKKINTLKQAIEASRKTYYARLKY